MGEDSLFHLLDSDTFSDVHKDTVVALNDHLVDHPGTSLRFLTAEAEGSGSEATVRAVWRNEVPYGFISTPEGSLNLRTIQAERLVPHLEHLWRTDPRARELWAASTTAVSDTWQYLQHHLQDTPLPADLSPAKQAWLDSQLGLDRAGAGSPLFAPELNPTLADFVGDHRIDQISGLERAVYGLQFSPRRTRPPTSARISPDKFPKDRVPTIGGRLPINAEYAGKTHPAGIRFTEQGFPDFRPHAVAERKIAGLIGEYTHDEALANLASGFERTPDGYVWHHLEDGKTMLLVPRKIHISVRHTGGSAVIRNGGFDRS